MVLSKCAICDSKKSRFIKNHEEKGLLRKITPLSKVPIFYFVIFSFKCVC